MKTNSAIFTTPVARVMATPKVPMTTVSAKTSTRPRFQEVVRSLVANAAKPSAHKLGDPTTSPGAPPTSPGGPPASPQGAPSAYPPDSYQARMDAYWAAQPAEVQALRQLEGDARDQKAAELASKGFKIDSAIMLQGWDPVQTMQNRALNGYTWIPGFKGDPVQVAPGLSFAGLRSYDPNSPPPGAIMVNTDFLNRSPAVT